MIHKISPKIDKLYRSFINNSYTVNSPLVEEKIELYNILFDLLIDDKEYKIVDEIKYRITGGEDATDVFIDVIENNDNLPFTLTFYLAELHVLKNYDWLERFS